MRPFLISGATGEQEHNPESEEAVLSHTINRLAPDRAEKAQKTASGVWCNYS